MKKYVNCLSLTLPEVLVVNAQAHISNKKCFALIKAAIRVKFIAPLLSINFFWIIKTIKRMRAMGIANLFYPNILANERFKI